MFGFNLKDEFGHKLYRELTWEELEALVAGMKAFAKSQPPFDYMKAKEEAESNNKVKTEMVGPMMRVAGNDSIKAFKDYNKFIRLGLNALQICYYEMEVPELGGRVGQLTIVDNYKMPLDKKLIAGFIDMFFDWKAMNWRAMETPPHVAVIVEPVK